jgi:monomeric sarcosine oxidase
MKAFDAIVIGVGGMGSAATGSLASRGLNVLGIEQFGIGHSSGSSHGQTRIIRQAYFEHPNYVPLLQRAYQLWEELEHRTGQTLFIRSGLVQIGRPDGNVIGGVDASASQHGLPVTRLSRQECLSQFPQFFLAEDHVAILEKNAGYLLVEDCVRALAETARSGGVTILENSPVLKIEPAARECIVRTATESFVAPHLVVTAGAWCRDLLPMPVRLRVLRKHLDWFESADPRMASANGCPAFLYELSDGCFYGFPAIDERGVKVAEHSGGEPIDDPSRLDDSVDPQIRNRIETFVRQHLPGVTLRHRHHQVCMYTMSPDEHFIVDRHPFYRNVVVVGGLSGHGFKFATVLGEVASQLIVDERPALPIEFLGFQRFAGQSVA